MKKIYVLWDKALRAAYDVALLTESQAQSAPGTDCVWLSLEEFKVTRRRVFVNLRGAGWRMNQAVEFTSREEALRVAEELGAEVVETPVF